MHFVYEFGSLLCQRAAHDSLIWKELLENAIMTQRHSMEAVTSSGIVRFFREAFTPRLYHECIFRCMISKWERGHP